MSHRVEILSNTLPAKSQLPGQTPPRVQTHADSAGFEGVPEAKLWAERRVAENVDELGEAPHACIRADGAELVRGEIANGQIYWSDADPE